MKNQYKIAIAISLALAAGSASAAGLTLTYDSGDSSYATPVNNGAGSSILLAVNDQQNGSANNGKTFLLDLALDGHSGLNYASFVNGTQGATSWNLGADSQFANFVADTAHLNWSVIGGSVLDSNVGTNLDATGNQAPFTAVAQWGALQTGNTNLTNSNYGAGGLRTGWVGINSTVIGTGEIGQTIVSANNSFTKLSPSVNEAVAPASGTGAFTYTANLPSAGTLGAASSGFFWVTNATGFLGGTDVNQINRLGTFSLSANDVLTWTPTPATTSAVPLPAGVWLFLSGMMGMLGLKRRNQQAAATA